MWFIKWVCSLPTQKASSGLRGVVHPKGLPLSPDEAAKLLSEVGATSGVTLRPSISKGESKPRLPPIAAVVPDLSAAIYTNRGLGGVSGIRTNKQVLLIE